MISILSNQVFRRLFAAQVLALLATGLMTMALGLLAFDMAGAQAGIVLGLALTIKMIAYIAFAPLIEAATASMPRKFVLIGAEVVRLLVALALPFVDAIWQVYALVFILQLVSDETDYTQALSLSRIASEAENIASPLLAGLLLSFMSFHWLFWGTALGFAISALLVLLTQIPQNASGTRALSTRPFWAQASQGLRLYLASPRLRGLLAFNVVVAAPGSFVFVNSVIVSGVVFARPEVALAWLMGAFGLGAICAALALPRLLARMSDRAMMRIGGTAMIGWAGAASLALLLNGHGTVVPWEVMLVIWTGLGLAFGAVVTPGGRLLRQSGDAPERPALFAAHFALSHVPWLLFYPLVGFSGAHFGLGPSMALMTGLGGAALVAAGALWPATLEAPRRHDHKDLPADHPHMLAHGNNPHEHFLRVDELHPSFSS